MKSRLFVLLAVMALSACGSLNSYDGPDSALINFSCWSDVTDDTGQKYSRLVYIHGVDEHMSYQSTQFCESPKPWPIDPKAKSLKVHIEFADNKSGVIYKTTARVSIEVRPKASYRLEPVLEAQKIRVRLINMADGTNLVDQVAADVEVIHIDPKYDYERQRTMDAITQQIIINNSGR